jgi:flagellum-specific peptidoglycan hydrolase FlgJ
VRDAARRAENKYGIPASVTTAQWALESSYGKQMPKGSNNPFGIKARAGQDFVETTTHEQGRHGLYKTTAKFAKFANLDEAFEAHAKLIATASVYKKAMARTWDTTLFTKELSKKYATDPRYAQKLLAFIHQDGAGRG